ncbi:coiled-coil domain-containing protein [Pectobacterium versatile]|uniref:hypothetical protein n=1 Tax=Pectobacterium versatile TaxID=2488639 RepID=UPI00102E258C|nr:hypothetical protein [Pectobacterium versatile]TAI99919.1 hypothetical protein EG332_04285 [Pectobacterium versatile]UEQ10483.1 hypothetical protein LLE50_05060 [Pectobacterium versatile]
MTEEKQLPELVITEAMAPAIYVPGGLDQFISQIREAVNEVPDLSTDKGRKRIASLAASVSRSKTAVEKPGRDYLRRLKEAVKPAEAELKRFVDTLDTLRDEVRRPLTEYENAEKARVEKLNVRLELFRGLGRVFDEFGKPFTTYTIETNLAHAKATAIDDSWQELTAEAGVAKDAVIVKLEAALIEAQKRDAEAAELERLRQEQAEAAQRQREEQIRREAEESAKRQAAEDLAAAQKREADAIAAKEQAQLLAKQAQERAEREAKEAAEQAERNRIALEQRAEREKQEAIDAERLRQQQVEQARQAELKRVADEEAARAANVEHQRGVNRQVMIDLVEHAHLTEEQAKAVLTAIVRGKVAPDNLSLRY